MEWGKCSANSCLQFKLNFSSSLFAGLIIKASLTLAGVFQAGFGPSWGHYTCLLMWRYSTDRAVATYRFSCSHLPWFAVSWLFLRLQRSRGFISNQTKAVLVLSACGCFCTALSLVPVLRMYLGGFVVSSAILSCAILSSLRLRNGELRTRGSDVFPQPGEAL